MLMSENDTIDWEKEEKELINVDWNSLVGKEVTLFIKDKKIEYVDEKPVEMERVIPKKGVVVGVDKPQVFIRSLRLDRNSGNWKELIEGHLISDIKRVEFDSEMKGKERDYDGRGDFK